MGIKIKTIKLQNTDKDKKSFETKQRKSFDDEIIKKETKINALENFLMKFSKIPLKEKLFFVQHLGVMLRVGISISKALSTLSLQTQNKYFKKVLSDIAKRVDGGERFSKCLQSYPKIFNNLFINIIKAGEESGKLEEGLKQLFTQMKKEHALISKVKGALTYPAVILLAMIGIGIFMMSVVIPKMTENFKEMGVELPLATRILIAVGNALQNNGIIVGIIAIIIIFLLIRSVKTKVGKKIFDAIMLRLPIFGSIIKKVNLARFSRNISSLLRTDIMIVNCFDIVSDVLGNYHYKKAMKEVGAQVKKGVTITESIKKYPKLFPPIVNQMVAIGEETGDLDNILVELAEFYETEVDQIMADLPSVIEPLLILFLGLGVGGVAIAIIMPMYSLSSAI